MIEGYHTDNGIFNILDFMEDLLKNHQKIIFSGAGSSHQNGAEDHDIKRVLTIKRTKLMHTMLRCHDDTFSTNIWTMEMYFDVWFYNWIPDM